MTAIRHIDQVRYRSQSRDYIRVLPKGSSRIMLESKAFHDVFVRFTGNQQSTSEKGLKEINEQLEKTQKRIQETYFDNIESANPQIEEFHMLMRRKQELLQSLGKASTLRYTLRIKLSETMYYEIPLEVKGKQK